MDPSPSASPSNSDSNSPSTGDLNSPLFKRGCEAIKLLYVAYSYAQQHSGSCWDFAEEIAELLQLGITNSDLRWLVSLGYLEHGHEITEIGEPQRRFQLESGLYFSPQTCFVLTDAGAKFVNVCLNGKAIVEPTFDLEVVTDLTSFNLISYKPSWNRDLQELKVGERIVKQFKVPAPNQEMILAVFQEEDWPTYIDDPLPSHPEIDPKRRLRDTINSLNRNQKDHLIHFRSNGSGDGVRFELVAPVNIDDVSSAE